MLRSVCFELHLARYTLENSSCTRVNLPERASTGLDKLLRFIRDKEFIWKEVHLSEWSHISRIITDTTYNRHMQDGQATINIGIIYLWHLQPCKHQKIQNNFRLSRYHPFVGHLTEMILY